MMRAWLILLGLSGVAHADPRAGEATFATLDRVDGRSRARLDFTYLGVSYQP